eukprot:7228474-Lingulodinium_polyedra.AAC.1
MSYRGRERERQRERRTERQRGHYDLRWWYAVGMPLDSSELAVCARPLGGMFRAGEVPLEP